MITSQCRQHPEHMDQPAEKPSGCSTGRGALEQLWRTKATLRVCPSRIYPSRNWGFTPAGINYPSRNCPSRIYSSRNWGFVPAGTAPAGIVPARFAPAGIEGLPLQELIAPAGINCSSRITAPAWPGQRTPQVCCAFTSSCCQPHKGFHSLLSLTHGTQADPSQTQMLWLLEQAASPSFPILALPPSCISKVRAVDAQNGFQAFPVQHLRAFLLCCSSVPSSWHCTQRDRGQR